jgi:hypothetical protein
MILDGGDVLVETLPPVVIRRRHMGSGVEFDEFVRSGLPTALSVRPSPPNTAHHGATTTTMDLGVPEPRSVSGRHPRDPRRLIARQPEGAVSAIRQCRAVTHRTICCRMGIAFPAGPDAVGGQSMLWWERW